MLDLIPRTNVITMTLPVFPSWFLWWRLQIRLWFARARCKIRGHVLTRKGWQNGHTMEVKEHHCGCLHCDLYWEEDVNFKRTKEPEYAFARPRFVIKRGETIGELKQRMLRRGDR